jgi:Protein of unknown function (DUF3048) N-terminal domain/Protein of unknown function (DUF3048) C-terminal domain
MHFLRFKIILVFVFLVSSCDIRLNGLENSGIPTSTPFQPQTENASGSPYSAAAPTPIYLPTITSLPPTPTEVVIRPELIPPELSAPTFTAPTNLNPLTGLPPSDLSLLDRRPLAIKVANYPRYIRPQSGLTLADNVFEYYIEAGLTRFIAVFYGNDSAWVGPVRSGRYFDEHIQRMYHAYLVFKFADPREMNHFLLSDFYDYLVVPTNGSCPPFRLMPNRNIEVYNNSYFNTILWEECVIQDGLENQRPTIRNGFFSEVVPQTELLGTQIFTYYSVDSYHYWVYRPDVQKYFRYQEVDDTRENKPEKYNQMMDAVTALPVQASNIVYIFAQHTFENSFDEDDEVYQIDLTGSGEAYVFRDGVGVVARWYRLNKDQPLLLAGLNGAPLYLRPGITFYEVLGARSYVDQDAGEWHFHHETP